MSEDTTTTTKRAPGRPRLPQPEDSQPPGLAAQVTASAPSAPGINSIQSGKVTVIHAGNQPYAQDIYRDLVKTVFGSMGFDDIKTLKPEEATAMLKHIAGITEIAVLQFEKKIG